MGTHDVEVQLIGLVLVGIPIAIAGGYTLARPASVHDWNERGSVALAKAMGINDRTAKPMANEKGWIIAAGTIIFLTGLALIIAGAIA